MDIRKPETGAKTPLSPRPSAMMPVGAGWNAMHRPRAQGWSQIKRDHIVLALAALLAFAVIIIGAVSIRGVDSASAPSAATASAREADDFGALPAEALPEVQPNEILVVAPNDAKAINARVPFVTGPNPAARPFIFAGSTEDRARAADCLAAAVLYEAGDDAVGQQAVAQVVLNRARHPAYPSTVCGVVFQGSERRTGCQFTFTCDGALNRQYSTAAWDRARSVAGMAIAGYVYAPVGLATHYHTDWVVPYWSDNLEKIAAVGTHLFFRWPGGWGKPAAFRQRSNGIEPGIGKMAKLSPAHALALGGPDIELADATAANALDAEVAAVTIPATATLRTDAAGRVSGTITPSTTATTGEAIVITLNKASDPDSFEALARTKCGDKSYCKVLGWTNASKVASSGDVSEDQRAAMSFSFLRNNNAGFEKALWNCKEFPRANKKQCMRGV